jgi:photosystem II stability/assembly factor-like uncharacterized protein
LRGLVATAVTTAIPMPGTRAQTAAATPLTSGAGSQASAARRARAADWVVSAPDLAAGRLFTPASGPLFAAGPAGLWRSDDAGASWLPVALPQLRAPDAAVDVDPTDHRVIYADTPAGLQRTDDDAATWTTILPSDRKVLRVAISPADPSVLYVAQAGASNADFWLLRSRDRGATWEPLEELRQAPCGWSSLILTPHPTDAFRLFRTDGCYAGRDLGDDLQESRDSGSTWRTALTPKTAFPHAIVGGGGLEPGRFYLSVNNDARSGGSLVYTSSDDGGSWTPVLEHKGGGTMSGPKTPSLTIGGLAYNPVAPGSIFVGVNSKSDPFKPIDFGSVMTTGDGGASWAALGQSSLPQIIALALGIDGQNLFAATAGGIMRIALG